MPHGGAYAWPGYVWLREHPNCTGYGTYRRTPKFKGGTYTGISAIGGEHAPGVIAINECEAQEMELPKEFQNSGGAFIHCAT